MSDLQDEREYKVDVGKVWSDVLIRDWSLIMGRGCYETG